VDELIASPGYLLEFPRFHCLDDFIQAFLVFIERGTDRRLIIIFVELVVPSKRW
jgi:hypothetical protein